MTAAELLRQRAADYRALREEHAKNRQERIAYELVELILLELADSIEKAEELEAA